MSHLHPNRADDDELFQRYLDRAINEINRLGEAIEACELCEHDGRSGRVLGTGHPLADVMLLKYAPTPSELDEGVAFFGRSGDAILKSIERLRVDPLDLYGTNCVKCSCEPTGCVRDRCPQWLLQEISIVEPRVMVVMGAAALEAVNALEVQESELLQPQPSTMQRWTHGCEALYCPDIDESLDRPAAKQAFWSSFRALGDWYADKPPW